MKGILRVFVLILTMPGATAYSQLALAALTPPDILNLLAAKNYSALDRIIIAQQKLHENGINNEKTILFTLNAFHSSNEGLEEQLNSWIAHKPEAYPAYLARGSHYVHIAGLHRGAKFAKDTTKSQFSRMADYHKRAIKDLGKVLLINRKVLYAYSMLVRVATSSGSWTDIVKLSDAGLSIDPTSYLIHRQIMFKFQPKWGGYKGSIDSWLELKVKPYLKKNPLLKTLFGYPDYIRAEKLNRKKDFKKAEKYFNQSIEKSSSDYNVLFLEKRGEYYFYRDEYKKALKNFDKALLQNPYYISSLELRGRTLTLMGRHKEALRDLNLAISLDQNNPDLRRARSYVYRKDKIYKAALVDSKASFKYGSYDNNNWRNQGYILLYGMNDYKGAEAAYKKAVKLYPDSETSWYQLGVAQYKQFSCDFIEPMKVYLDMCKKRKCDNALTKWSASVSTMAVGRGFCKTK